MDKQIIRHMVHKVMHDLTGNGGIPVAVSNRHLHLCQAHLDVLFGEGSALTPIKELMGGEFAAKECVTIVGPKLKSIEGVRVVGHLRSFSQVEISKTDSYTLGIDAPLRDSGDIKGSAPIAIVGPKGSIFLKEGCIIARRHIHMSPADAANFGTKDKEIVKVRIQGPRGGVLDNVLVRVAETFTLEMHIDTDEANGLGISSGDFLLIE